MKYGILSDTHQNPKVVPLALALLKKEGAEKLIVNGDVGTGQSHMAFTLDCVGRTGLEAFVQLGSHETLGEFGPVIDAFSDRYASLHDAFKFQKIEVGDHNLVFLPGSDFLCGGEYQLADVDLHSGIYKTKTGNVRLINMQDLTRLVNDPGRTIVFSHVPMKFDNFEKGVDVAYFAEKMD